MGTSMVRPRHAIVLSVALALASFLFGQAEQSVKGFVVTKDGQPIAGVSVQGQHLEAMLPVSARQDIDGNGGYQSVRIRISMRRPPWFAPLECPPVWMVPS